MASSMTKISSVTVGAGGASTVSFTGIPQTGYTDLVIKGTARGTSSTTSILNVSFNGSTSGFTDRYIEGNGASAGSYLDQPRMVGLVNGTGATANTFTNFETYIPNYTSANYKSFSADIALEDNTTIAYLELQTGLWSNAAAITSITLAPLSGSFVQYSTFTLYGVTKYAETGTGSKATGGTVTTSGGYTYHTFFNSGMFTPSTSITGAEVLSVAGGGGTQGAVSGGAGAGGLVYASSQSFASGTGYAVVVGAGGAPGVNGVSKASNGTNSFFANGTVAIGGGAGNGSAGVSGSGGSGGGGAAPGSGGIGSGTAGQGNSGGVTSGAYSGGGGGAGAAGSAGGTNGRAGDGGVGLSTYSTWGAATNTGENSGGTYWYAGGGGGSAWNGVSANNIGGQGGLGGGGQGAGGTPQYASNGMANTGGGAGGDNGYVFKGGSGIVIVRYTT